MQLRNQKGFTLIEIAIVLTIVGLVIGGIWLAASTVLNNNKKSAATSQIIQIVQNTKNLFANQTGSNPAQNFDEDVGREAGIFPAGMVVGTAIRHPFSTGTANSVTMNGATNRITLNYGLGAPPTDTALPRDACIEIATRVATTENFGRYGIVSVNGLTAATATNATRIAGSCTATNTDVNIIFTVP